MTVERKIARALADGGATHSWEDVLNAIARGDAQIWREPGALIVTQIDQYPQYRALRFWLAAGEMEPVMALHRRILDWGRDEMGCTRAVLWGRKGWARFAAREGWKPTTICYEREL